METQALCFFAVFTSHITKEVITLKFLSFIKVDPSKLIGVGLAGLGLAQMVLSNKAQSYERNALKEDLKKELLAEIKSSK